MTNSIIAALTAVDAAYHDLSLGWQIASYLLMAALGTGLGVIAVDLFAALMVRLTRRREPWALEPIKRRECETYCRTCRAYKVTPETYCDICFAPLLLFPDAIAMADHMAKTFPLPAAKYPVDQYRERPAFVAYRGGRVS